MVKMILFLPEKLKLRNISSAWLLSLIYEGTVTAQNLKIIFTMDITSLYTIIPNNEGLQVLKYFFNQRPIKKPSSETLLRLAELVLTLNCFSFADNY